MKVKFLYCVLLFLVHQIPIKAEILLNGQNDEIAIVPQNSLFDQPNNGVPEDKRFWIRADITKTNTAAYLLECLSPHIRDVEVVIFSGKQKISHYRAGTDYPFRKRVWQHKNFTFPIPDAPGKYILLIGIKDIKAYELYFKVRTVKNFAEYALNEYYLLGFYYGILGIVLIYNLLLFYKSASKLHLYYSLYIIGCILLSCREDGIVYQFVLPSYPILNKIFIQFLSHPFYLISFLLYAYEFLEWQKYRGNIVNTFIAVAGLIILFEAVTFRVPFVEFISEWFYFLIILSVYITSHSLAKKGNKFGYYFLIGFSVILLSFLINILRIYDLLPSNILTVYIFNYGIILEVIIFSTALAERVRQVHFEKESNREKLLLQLEANYDLQSKLINELNEKKELQEKVNKELENKVKERTVELQNANEKLKEYAAKLDMMNSALDKFNYQLKNQIKDEKFLRIYNQEISFQQFSELYPNDDSCLKVIQELKWPEGFVCRKCGYDKASNVEVWYRKKCNRCGTIESITSNTLFHHLKFPLIKAFYLTYVQHATLSYTNEQLSEILDLRKSTVWAFRQKVDERLKSRKGSKTISWKEIIVDLM